MMKKYGDNPTKLRAHMRNKCANVITHQRANAADATAAGTSTYSDGGIGRAKHQKRRRPEESVQSAEGARIRSGHHRSSLLGLSVGGEEGARGARTGAARWARGCSRSPMVVR